MEVEVVNGGDVVVGSDCVVYVNEMDGNVVVMAVGGKGFEVQQEIQIPEEILS